MPEMKVVMTSILPRLRGRSSREGQTDEYILSSIETSCKGYLRNKGQGRTYGVMLASQGMYEYHVRVLGLLGK